MSQSLVQDILQRLTKGETLSFPLAEAFTQTLMQGEVTEIQTAAVLTALAMRGETSDEIAAFASAMRSHSLRITAPENAIDTCGTGGDGRNTFNISTAAAIVAAAAGVPVAKHGNRSATSRSGSADVLEQLGVSVTLEPHQAEYCLNEAGICFLYARTYHPAMKYAAKPRQQLGFRTIFNILGPLTNPAHVKRQVIGVFKADLVPIVAEALLKLGSEHALVMHGSDGLDEFTLSGETLVAELCSGNIRNYTLTPEEVSLPRADVSELVGGDAADNARMMLDLFAQQRPGAILNAVLYNAAAALYVAGQSNSIREGVAVAQQILKSGAALAKLQQLVQSSQDAQTMGKAEEGIIS
ncbi:anthranilate phosphoribosyltransferase [Alicyclobacillus sp. TC]|uniref:anthranilate phosphoribosyltransferase n=1 Tax=Alicyclobacillus sp. TC TaxID=2606450 RepID=UPI0019337858|nr:anthranilate phosphoribosyltransferase [Alicyclobacillus sp. TC]QRF23364.1 anthranilate phosphoribosyltransferase [Alicyclobacillus sp. TC]